MTSIRQVVGALEDLGISFALIGAHAVGVRGYPRMTVDYDFLTTDRRVLQRASWESLERTGAKIDIRIGDADDPLGGVVHVTLDSGDEADIVVGKWKWEQGTIDRADIMQVGDMSVRVPRTVDLILLKLAAGGFLDQQDVSALLEVSDREAIIREVNERIGDLPPAAAALWQNLRTRTIR